MRRGVRVIIASAAWTTLVGCGSVPPETPMDGGVVVSTTVQRCPRLTSLGASPASVDVGSWLALTAWGGVAGGDVPTYAWQAPSGRIADPRSPVTRFECTAPGPVTITCVVANDGCEDRLSVSVDCTAPAGRRHWSWDEFDPRR
jgi:hypothetical protein